MVFEGVTSMPVIMASVTMASVTMTMTSVLVVTFRVVVMALLLPLDRSVANAQQRRRDLPTCPDVASVFRIGPRAIIAKLQVLAGMPPCEVVEAAVGVSLGAGEREAPRQSGRDHDGPRTTHQAITPHRERLHPEGLHRPVHRRRLRRVPL